MHTKLVSEGSSRKELPAQQCFPQQMALRILRIHKKDLAVMVKYIFLLNTTMRSKWDSKLGHTNNGSAIYFTKGWIPYISPLFVHSIGILLHRGTLVHTYICLLLSFADISSDNCQQQNKTNNLFRSLLLSSSPPHSLHYSSWFQILLSLKLSKNGLKYSFS